MKSQFLKVGVMCILCAGVAIASDHSDGPRAAGRPVADLADLFAWWSEDEQYLNLVLTIHPDAKADTSFGPELAYVFHLSDHAELGQPTAEAATLACFFPEPQVLHCKLGDLVLEGSATDVLESADGSVRIVAGRRSDPASWNRRGYEATIRAVHDGIFGGEIQLEYDEFGCPLLATEVQEMIQFGLSHDSDGMAAVNAYAGQDVLAIEATIAADRLPGSGDLVGVWAATYDWEANQ